MTKSNLGNVLIKMGTIKEKQLIEACRRQIETQDLRLGVILIEMGVCSEQQIRDALKYQGQIRSGKEVEAMTEINRAASIAALMGV